MTLLTSVTRSQKENIFNDTDSVMLHARMHQNARGPSPDPAPSALRRFTPHEPQSPSAPQSFVPERRNQKLATLSRYSVDHNKIYSKILQLQMLVTQNLKANNITNNIQRSFSVLLFSCSKSALPLEGRNRASIFRN